MLVWMKGREGRLRLMGGEEEGAGEGQGIWRIGEGRRSLEDGKGGVTGRNFRGQGRNFRGQGRKREFGGYGRGEGLTEGEEREKCAKGVDREEDPVYGIGINEFGSFWKRYGGEGD